ncbi:MAG: 3-keto-disaccharide hydrolase [Fimbriimonas sp.]
MSEIYGRWDLMVGAGDEAFPSWVEIGQGQGSFVGRVGSARPLAQVDVDGNRVTFSLPKQYEGRETHLAFTGELKDGKLVGTTTLDDGTESVWSGDRAPELANREPSYGDPVNLIEGDLSNWHPRSPEWESHWKVEDGALVNTGVGSDLVSNAKFTDFRLEAEYSYPAGSNSGIYLRGRYEFQILDDYEGGKNGVGNSAAIYGFLAPSRNAVKPPTEWNTVEITLIGRFVTVVLNGETVIDGGEIPGITGGALDSKEGEPGPIFLQGDHGPVTFRKLTITPA